MTSVTGSDISLPWQRAKIRLWALNTIVFLVIFVKILVFSVHHCCFLVITIISFFYIFGAQRGRDVP